MSDPELDRTLAALADPHRRRVIALLCQRPHRAGELAQAARISFPAMSRHLRMLRRCGLVVEGRDADDSRVRLYRLRPEPLEHLGSWLAQTRAHSVPTPSGLETAARGTPD